MSSRVSVTSPPDGGVVLYSGYLEKLGGWVKNCKDDTRQQRSGRERGQQANCTRRDDGRSRFDVVCFLWFARCLLREEAILRAAAIAATLFLQ